MLCEICITKSCIKTGKPCKEVEDYLQLEGIRSSQWIRPQASKKKQKDGKGRWREIPFTALSDVDIDRNPILREIEGSDLL